MKRLIISIILLLSCLFAFTPQVLAANVFGGCSGTASSTQVCQTIKSQTTSGTNPILKTMKTVIAILGIIIGVASVIVIIIAGITFVTGGSDPQTVARARNMLLYAIVGVFVSVLAESLVVFILKTV